MKTTKNNDFFFRRKKEKLERCRTKKKLIGGRLKLKTFSFSKTRKKGVFPFFFFSFVWKQNTYRPTTDCNREYKTLSSGSNSLSLTREVKSYTNKLEIFSVLLQILFGCSLDFIPRFSGVVNISLKINRISWDWGFSYSISLKTSRQ